MTTTSIDAQGLIRSMLARGWTWSAGDTALLVHPSDHDLALRYDQQTNRLTISPKLEAHLSLVIPTPAKGRSSR